jgi:hypothetical protein
VTANIHKKTRKRNSKKDRERNRRILRQRRRRILHRIENRPGSVREVPMLTRGSGIATARQTEPLLRPRWLHQEGSNTTVGTLPRPETPTDPLLPDRRAGLGLLGAGLVARVAPRLAAVAAPKSSR